MWILSPSSSGPEMYIGSRPGRRSAALPVRRPRYTVARPKSACRLEPSSRAYPIAPSMSNLAAQLQRHRRHRLVQA